MAGSAQFFLFLFIHLLCLFSDAPFHKTGLRIGVLRATAGGTGLHNQLCGQDGMFLLGVWLYDSKYPWSHHYYNSNKLYPSCHLQLTARSKHADLFFVEIRSSAAPSR